MSSTYFVEQSETCRSLKLKYLDHILFKKQSFIQKIYRTLLYSRSMYRNSLLLYVTIFYACSSIPPPTQQIHDPKVLMTHINSVNQNIQSIRGELSVEFWHKDQRVRVRQMFLSALPNYLYLDTLIPSGQPMSSLLSDGKNLYLYEIREQRVYRGALNQDTFAKLSTIRLPPEWFTLLLTGHIPLLDKKSKKTIQWDQEKGWYLLKLNQAQHIQKIWVRPHNFTVAELQLLNVDAKSKSTTMMIHIQLGQFTQKKHKIPQRIRVHLPIQKTQIEVKFKEFEINPQIDLSIFTLQAPATIPIEDL